MKIIPWEDNLKKSQKELIIGCLLGDGRLECRSNSETTRLRIHQADSQKDYLFWKYDKLKNLVKMMPRMVIYRDKRNRQKYISWYFHTITTNKLKFFYLMFYRNRKKYCR